jgi:hypothetical protein
LNKSEFVSDLRGVEVQSQFMVVIGRLRLLLQCLTTIGQLLLQLGHTRTLLLRRRLIR